MQPKPRRRTKIVCTLGPATDSPEGIAALLEAGMDVVRLNFSHGDRESHRRTIGRIREAGRKTGHDVGILQDLGGPKIRLGELPEGGVVLEAGTTVDLGVAGHTAAGVLPVRYPHLVEDVGVGEQILLADGLIELEVQRVAHDRLVCRVVNGGTVTSRKGVNLPQANLRVASFTDKDRADLAVGLEEGVDFVALSFVRHEDDLAPVRRILSELEHPPMLIAKIEKPQAVDRLDPILEAVDGVMVARGDLGVEMPPEKVPMIQKTIIAAARRAGRPVITATQMLRSMVDSPRPLRAEASDVANAVLDGTDAVMLSEETAIGRYPTDAVGVLNLVALEAEPHLDSEKMINDSASPQVPEVTGAVSRAACELAASIGAAAIVTTTASGATARLVARLRPKAPILGVTTSPEVARQLELSWGVIPAVTPATDDISVLGQAILRELTRRGLAKRGDSVVVTAGLPLGFSDSTNLLRIHRLE
jgi:pyruvate kinase